MRYEYESPMSERFDRAVRGFDRTTQNPIATQAIANYAKTPIAQLPVSQFQVRGGLLFAGANGHELWSGQNKTLLPRAGLAYQVDGSTVIRAGYGIFYDTIGVNRTPEVQTGYTATTPIQASLDNGLHFVATTANPFPNGLLAPQGSCAGLQDNPNRKRAGGGERGELGCRGGIRDVGVTGVQTCALPIYNGLHFVATTANPFPNGLLAPQGSSAGLQTNLGQALTVYPLNRVQPYSQRWTFDVQRTLFKDFLLDAGYVGSKAIHLGVDRNLNATPNQYFSTSPVRDQATNNALSATVTNPFAGIKPIYPKTITVALSALMVAWSRT